MWWKKIWIPKNKIEMIPSSYPSSRLFKVLYFSVRLSRSNTLRHGLPSCMSVKTTQGAGAVWEEVRKIFFSPPSPYSYNPRHLSLGTFENQDCPPLTVRRAISQWSHDKIGDCKQCTLLPFSHHFLSWFPLQLNSIKEFIFVLLGLPSLGGMDLGALLTNPAIMNMVSLSIR